MTYKEILDYCIEQFKEKGMSKSKCMLNQSEVRELYFNNGDISMLRTTFNYSLQLTAMKDHKKGTILINKVDKNSLDAAIKETASLI